MHRHIHLGEDGVTITGVAYHNQIIDGHKDVIHFPETPETMDLEPLWRYIDGKAHPPAPPSQLEKTERQIDLIRAQLLSIANYEKQHEQQLELVRRLGIDPASPEGQALLPPLATIKPTALALPSTSDNYADEISGLSKEELLAALREKIRSRD